MLSDEEIHCISWPSQLSRSWTCIFDFIYLFLPSLYCLNLASFLNISFNSRNVLHPAPLVYLVKHIGSHGNLNIRNLVVLQSLKDLLLQTQSIHCSWSNGFGSTQSCLTREGTPYLGPYLGMHSICYKLYLHCIDAGTLCRINFGHKMRIWTSLHCSRNISFTLSCWQQKFWWANVFEWLPTDESKTHFLWCWHSSSKCNCWM